MDIKNNENRECCARCKTRCCENIGCEIFPEDVIGRYGDITVDVIMELIHTDVVMMDIYDDDPDEGLCGGEGVRLLRIRTIDNRMKVDQAWFGKCILLTDTGCKLSWDNRPTGAKILVPNLDNPGEGCTCLLPDYNGKKTFAKMWLPYHDVMKEAEQKIYEEGLCYDG